MCHDWEWPAPAFSCRLTETHRHPNRMYSHDQLVQGVKSIVLLWNVLHQGQYYIRRRLVLTSETDSNRLIILIFTVLYPYSNHVTFEQILNALWNKSFKLTRKWLTGSESSYGGRRRTTSCEPIAPKRLYWRVIVSSISNLVCKN